DIRWFPDEATLIRDEAGSPAYWQGIMYDITAERETEERARESEDRYRTLLEQIPAIVYREEVTGDGLKVVYINARVQELIGISPEEWLRDPSVWLDAIHEDDREYVTEEDRRTELTGEPFLAEYRMRSRDGRVVWFRDQAVVMRGPDGEPAYWQGVMVDRTEQRRHQDGGRDLEGERTEAERRRAEDEMKTPFLHAVAHDLRPALAAIRGLAVTMERDDIDITEDENRDMARRI